MADNIAHHTQTSVTPEEPAPVAVEETTTTEVTAAPTEETAAELEQTFSTAVEPSDAPVLNADDTPHEPSAEETTAEETTTAAEGGEEAAAISPPVSSGSDKKSKSWISKLTNNFKKLADKKPKTEKTAETSAATEEVSSTAETAEGEAAPEATTIETPAIEETPATVETDAVATVPATTEHAAEEKPVVEHATEEASLSAAAQKPLAKRLSFNFFKKSNKADKEKAPTTTPAPVTEAPEGDEEGEAPAAPAKDEEEEAAPPIPAKDIVPVIEAPHVPTDLVVEETAVTAVH
ncbi:hypothetical protein EDD21DRAFT_367896 [Dissophora ornata]|nr:hypothetical protein BGZ58_005571 [Dissophora ornata]KAI8603857.1 hypothetical protein EDD21DRAFT_367896 [Dissophora ornata]